MSPAMSGNEREGFERIRSPRVRRQAAEGGENQREPDLDACAAHPLHGNVLSAVRFDSPRAQFVLPKGSTPEAPRRCFRGTLAFSRRTRRSRSESAGTRFVVGSVGMGR